MEFALQQRQPAGSWSGLLRPVRRIVGAGAPVGRWLASSPLAVGVGNTGWSEPPAQVEVRVVARRLSSGRTEMAVQQRRNDDAWGERLLPPRRFFPVGAEVGTWLVSGHVTLTAQPFWD